MLWAWIAIALYLEVYGIAVACLEKKQGNPRFWLCLIPYVAFAFVDRRLKGFTVLTLRIKSLLMTMLIMSGIAATACLVSKLGSAHFPESASVPLSQLMLVPIGFACFAAYVSLACASSALLFHFHAAFQGDLLVCLLLLPIPVLILCLAFRKEKTE